MIEMKARSVHEFLELISPLSGRFHDNFLVLHGFPGNAALIFRKKKALSR